MWLFVKSTQAVKFFGHLLALSNFGLGIAVIGWTRIVVVRVRNEKFSARDQLWFCMEIFAVDNLSVHEVLHEIRSVTGILIDFFG